MMGGRGGGGGKAAGEDCRRMWVGGDGGKGWVVVTGEEKSRAERRARV